MSGGRVSVSLREAVELFSSCVVLIALVELVALVALVTLVELVDS